MFQRLGIYQTSKSEVLVLGKSDPYKEKYINICPEWRAPKY